MMMLTKKRLRKVICIEYVIAKELLNELKILDPESGMLGCVDKLNELYNISVDENTDVDELSRIDSTITNIREIILSEYNLQKQKKTDDFLIAEIRKNTERLKQLVEQLSKGCGKCEDENDNAEVESINNYIANLQKEIDEDKRRFDSEG